MDEKIKQAIEKLAEKIDSGGSQQALEWAHAILYLKQALATKI